MVEFRNLTKVEFNERFLKKVASNILEGEKQEADLSVVFMGLSRMRKLNDRYCYRDCATDVLSFGRESVLSKEKFIMPPEMNDNLGEVVVCPGCVRNNAKRFGVLFEKELTACIIHGILHLLGYNHERGGNEAKQMFRKQNYYLRQMFKR